MDEKPQNDRILSSLLSPSQTVSEDSGIGKEVVLRRSVIDPKTLRAEQGSIHAWHIWKPGYRQDMVKQQRTVQAALRTIVHLRF